MACQSCKNKRRRKRAKVSGLSTGAKVAIGVGLFGVGVAVYMKINGIENKILIDRVTIEGYSMGKIQLRVTIVNLSTVNLPFNGYNGYLIYNDSINLGNVLIKDVQTIPASSEIALDAYVTPNLLALPATAKDVINAIKTKNYAGMKLELDGYIFVKNLSIKYKTQIA